MYFLKNWHWLYCRLCTKLFYFKNNSICGFTHNRTNPVIDRSTDINLINNRITITTVPTINQSLLSINLQKRHAPGHLSLITITVTCLDKTDTQIDSNRPNKCWIKHNYRQFKLCSLPLMAIGPYLFCVQVLEYQVVKTILFLVSIGTIN